MLMHCVNNTIAAVLSRIPQFKDADTFIDVLSPWAYTGAYIACLLIVGSAIIVLQNFKPVQKA